MNKTLKITLATVLQETMQMSGWIGDPKATRLQVEDLVSNHGHDGAVDALVEFENAIKFVNETLSGDHNEDLMKYLPK